MARDIERPQPIDSFLNVRDYGAVGDGHSLDSPAVQQAIDSLRESGGGTVYFPAGTYLCGTIVLTDNITLHLDAGAVLVESYRDGLQTAVVSTIGAENRARPHLIHAANARNISICGYGEIHGRGASDDVGTDMRERGFRTGIIYLVDCIGVKLRDFTIRHGDSWTVHMHGCEEVFIHGISVLNNLFRCGGNDGLDINCCRNVMISNCRIEAWDDCIVLKTKDRDQVDDAVTKTCENVVVTNCVLRSGCTALKIGSETKGAFRDIHFNNCTIRDSSVGFGIYLLDGAMVERVSCTNVSMEIISDDRYRRNRGPHFLHIWPFCVFIDRRTPRSRLGRIRDLTLRDIQACSDFGAVILGNAENPIENLTLDNITLRVRKCVPYFPRLLPCHPAGLEDGDRIDRESLSDDAFRIIPARPSDLPKYRPAYLNIEHVTDLSFRDLSVYLTDEAATDNNRVALSIENVKDSQVHKAGRWRVAV